MGDDDDGQIFNYWNLNCLRARRSCGIKCLNSDRDNIEGDNKFRGHQQVQVEPILGKLKLLTIYNMIRGVP